MQICSLLMPLALLCTLATACSSTPPSKLSSEEFICWIGQTQLRVQVEQSPGSDLVFINLHDDENTGVEAARQLIRQIGGRLVQLEHDGSRLITFVSGGISLKFDPNRMFTDQGAKLTLEKHASFSEKAFREVRLFAAEVLTICRFDELSLVVTIHNNGDQGYSAESYTNGAEYETDALKVHLESGVDPDDFFFVTEESLFDYFKAKRFNVVLQHNAEVSDDGSLSVLAGWRGIPYINVEAEHGHLKKHLEMLQEVHSFYGN